ncbi:hypothetical protein [Sinorhizobium fredii]|uniref:hypothetical protein n=1 Tax=Rhizobium fredii TaxID=380 RepID=UPI0004B0BBA3|nr:hypothetical protein [Sinorhizobium fredii]AWI61201.1 hypothetical protein AB395_00006024 [Sinorhizobium fredii CCBAU 45436]
MRFVARLPVAIFVGIARALFYSAWCLAFYVFCMFRPFTGMMIVAAIVMVPMSIVVFANPDAANRMPFRAFALMMIGLVAIAVGYSLFVDWITPPGVVDPFARDRSDRR